MVYRTCFPEDRTVEVIGFYSFEDLINVFLWSGDYLNWRLIDGRGGRCWALRGSAWRWIMSLRRLLGDVGRLSVIRPLETLGWLTFAP